MVGKRPRHGRVRVKTAHVQGNSTAAFRRFVLQTTFYLGMAWQRYDQRGKRVNLSLSRNERYKENWGADSMPASFRLMQDYVFLQHVLCLLLNGKSYATRSVLAHTASKRS
eukprot:2783471-Amphidinium_carterae.1